MKTASDMRAILLTVGLLCVVRFPSRLTGELITGVLGKRSWKLCSVWC